MAHAKSLSKSNIEDSRTPSTQIGQYNRDIKCSNTYHKVVKKTVFFDLGSNDWHYHSWLLTIVSSWLHYSHRNFYNLANIFQPCPSLNTYTFQNAIYTYTYQVKIFGETTNLPRIHKLLFTLLQNTLFKQNPETSWIKPTTQANDSKSQISISLDSCQLLPTRDKANIPSSPILLGSRPSHMTVCVKWKEQLSHREGSRQFSRYSLVKHLPNNGLLHLRCRSMKDSALWVSVCNGDSR